MLNLYREIFHISSKCCLLSSIWQSSGFYPNILGYIWLSEGYTNVNLMKCPIPQDPRGNSWHGDRTVNGFQMKFKLFCNNILSSRLYRPCIKKKKKNGYFAFFLSSILAFYFVVWKTVRIFLFNIGYHVCHYVVVEVK